MPGGFFPSSGTSTAPNKSYFGLVPDKFSALIAGYQDNINGIHIPGDGHSCDLVNKWLVYNPSHMGGTNVNTSSFGGFITAPDGTTNTMQKLVEGSNTGIHAVTSLFRINNNNTVNTNKGGFKMRCSVMVKAAERTRFAIYCADTRAMDPGFGGGQVGCKTVFDVGGGQIAVANTAFGTPTGGGLSFVPGPTEIVSFGSGVYRCTMDVTAGECMAQGTQLAYLWGILVDSGSGTAAENTNYAGNGSSGLYFWKSTLLPPAAWGLNNVTFFDDFTSLSTIDVNDTRVPGFKWYVHNTWPNPAFALQSPTLSAKLSIVGGTQLKIDFPACGGIGINSLLCLCSAVTDGGSGHIGTTYQAPGLFECSTSWDGFTKPNNAGPTFWGRTVETLQDASDKATWFEADWFEWQPGGAPVYPAATLTYGGPSSAAVNNGGGASASGRPIWYSTYSYMNADIVYRLGVLYQSISSPNLNHPPESSPGNWSVFSPAPLEPQIPTQLDWTQLSIFSGLWLPFTANDVGQVLIFFNGVAAAHTVYAPSGFLVNPIYVGERLQQTLMYGTNDLGAAFIDFIRLTQ
jgi:hypothetical protein